MRTRTAQWFETRVRYDKMMEDGQQKKVIEQYVVDALSFGEAEELSGTLLFLCDEEYSGFITGVILPVDGGFSAYSGV